MTGDAPPVTPPEEIPAKYNSRAVNFAEFDAATVDIDRLTLLRMAIEDHRKQPDRFRPLRFEPQ